MVLIDQEMFGLWAPENEGRVFAPTQGLHLSSLWNVLSDSIVVALIKYGCEKYGKNNIT